VFAGPAPFALHQVLGKEFSPMFVPFRFPAIAFVAIVLAGPSTPLAAEEKPVPADKINKITAALPLRAPAMPARPRKVLAYTQASGFVHGSIPVGAKAVQLMGEKTATYQTVISDDKEMFQPEKLREFDAASDCSYKWAEYGKLVGGYFNGHPWGKITMKIDDPSSPINAVFGGEPYTISDEIYTFKDPYSRDRMRILLSVDLEKSGITKGNRADNDYAICWIQKYGEGRVYYNALGHREETFWNPEMLQHFLAGIQFALGDLPCDTTPSGPLK
jgi:hypothetical protein